MKAPFLRFAMGLSILVVFWACTPQADSSSSPTSAAETTEQPAVSATPAAGASAQGILTAQDTISVDTAFAWAKRWETLISSTNMPLIQGFTLPIIDLSQVVQAGADSARFYLGREVSGEYKLMLVGVNDKGQDMVNDSPTTPLYRVYDLSKPCPPDCGSTIK